jgi:predicted ATPase
MPTPTLRLIGRDDELAQLREALTRQRMVSLVGPGGRRQDLAGPCAAHELSGHFDQHVHLARLATVSNPADVRWQSPTPWGVPLDGADPNSAVRARLLAYLSSRRALIVLDNCEHVIDAVAILVDASSAVPRR